MGKILERIKYQYKLLAYAKVNDMGGLPVSLIEECYKRDVVCNRLM
jgi:hypothetical protein